MTEVRSGLRPYWYGVPALGAVTVAIVASMGISNAGPGGEAAFLIGWSLLSAAALAWVATSRLGVDREGKLSVSRLGWSRSVDLRRLSEVTLHPDVVAGNAAQHWRLELRDEEGGRLRITTVPVYRRSREVFGRIDHAVKDRGVSVSGPTRWVLDHMTS